MLFKRKKKGIELSMNVIIIAALALVVLVVVILIFSGRIRAVNRDLDNCDSKGGRCEPGVSTSFGYTCPEGKAKVTANCGDESTVCCISLT